MKILTIAGISLLSFSMYASTHVTGTFFPTHTCSAYLSKNQKSNPDQIRISPREEYSLVEINRDPNPDWFRIKIPHHAQSLRWVSKTCGKANYYPWVNRPSCNNSPGLADTYVLALSWLPGFCETYGFEVGKAECHALQDNFYGTTHLSLHGLWPNQKNCGTNYGFCGVEPKSRLCDYPEINLSPDTSRQLKKAMPSYAYGTCLERHEWNKHGSCQLLSHEDYFILSTRLVKEVNETPLGEYLHAHVGDTVRLSDLKAVVSAYFGDASVNKIYIGCQHGILVDIWLQLPADLSQPAPLKALVSQGMDYQLQSNCPSDVVISNFKTPA